MLLDSPTLLAASCALMVLFGGAFIFLWALDRSARWLLWWGVPFVVIGLALALYLRRDWESDIVSIALGNAVRIFAVGGLWAGARVFEGRRAPWLALSGMTALWVALCLYPPFLENMTARVVVVSLLHALACGLAAYELGRGHGERLRTRLPTLVVLASTAAVMLARAVVADRAPFPLGSGPLDPLVLAIFSWTILAFVLFSGILFLAMTMERREAEQRGFAMSDPLTGLLNRRAFADFTQRLARRAAVGRGPLAMLVLDIDNFKQVNDCFGHEAGDRMLKAFADMSESTVRPTDQLFRMGGEEFCCVLPETALPDAIAVAERLRRAFEAIAIDTVRGSASTTVSIGIAAAPTALDIDVLFAAADAAAYEAKARGRNRVVVSEPAALLRLATTDARALRRSA